MKNQEWKKLLVWNKGGPATLLFGNEYKFDDYGTLMKYSEYGNRDSELGWEIDHRQMSSFGGSDDISNLRPLNWRSNLMRNRKSFFELLT